MARAIWTGSISFGLLNVPVKLYSAVSKKSVSFRELRASDSSRVRHKRVAESDGEEVDYNDIVKGYEIAPDQYVVITKDELEELDPKKTRAIEIQDFVDLDDIDPIYFDHPYYLGPDKGAERAYGLLVKAMDEAHKVAIARFVLRNRESLAAIRPMDDVLTMATMRFADEVVTPDELEDVLGEDVEAPKKKELEMAKALIDSLTSDFDAAQYRDEYREELLALIESKAKGEAIASPAGEAPKPTKAPDLMAALEESLAAVKGEEDKSKSAEPAAKSGSKTNSKPKRTPEPIAKQGKGREVEVDGRKLALTNLDKVLWPSRRGGRGGSKPAFAKGQAIDFYARIADTILPHLRGRALTRVRFPDGVEGQRFFEKRAPKHTPDWVKTASIEMGSVGVLDFIVCDERPTLIWLAQLAALELHPSLALAKKPERPTVLAFDLDPGEPATAVECAQVALLLRELFDNLGLDCLAKHSGSKGIQVYVPLNTAVTYEHTKSYARAVAQALERSEPDLVVSKQDRKLRKGKVLVDWSQNDYSKTTVAVYSLRCRPRPWVSMPLTWDEVTELADDGDPESVRFEAPAALERVAERGDLFAAVLDLKQKLPRVPSSG